MVNRTSIDSASSGSMPAASPADRCPRWRLYVFLVVLLLLLGCFGRFAYLRITLKPTPRPEYWAAELRKHFPSPPDGVPLRDVEEALQRCPFFGSPGTAFDGSFMQYRGYLKYIRDHVPFQESAFNQSLEELVRVLDHPWAVCGIADLQNGSLEQWWNLVHGWHDLLMSRADWHIQNRRTVEARTDLLRSLKLARRILDQPTSGLQVAAFTVQRNVGWYILNVAADLTNPFACDRDFVAEAENLVGELIPHDRLYFCSRLAHLQELEEVYVLEGSGWLSVSEVLNRQWGKPLKFSPFWNLASPLFHSYAEARAAVEKRYRDLPGQIIKTDNKFRPCLPTLPLLDGAGALDELTLETSTLDCARLAAHQDALTQMEAALAALAVGHYRSVHGKYPQRLEDLVPSILRRMPRDYPGNRPLSYRLKPETKHGFVLYTYGYDKKDDGGVPAQETAERDEILFPQAPWRWQ